MKMLKGIVFAGVMAALAAILLTGRIGSTRPNLAMGWELDTVFRAYTRRVG